MNTKTKIGMLFDFKTCMLLGLLAASDVVAASVWIPTASENNLSSYGSGGKWNSASSIGIVEATVGITEANNQTASIANGSTISFVQNGSNWDITVASLTPRGSRWSTHTFLGSNQFNSEWLTNGARIEQSVNHAYPWTPNLQQSIFIYDFPSFNNSRTLNTVKFWPSSSILAISLTTSVPLPATVWLFLAGVFGLLALGKRR